MRPQPRHAVGLLLSAVRAGDIDRQLLALGAHQQHWPQNGAQQQMRAVARLRPT